MPAVATPSLDFTTVSGPRPDWDHALNPTAFYMGALARYGMRRAVRAGLRRSYLRTPVAVIEEYDRPRRALMERFRSEEWSIEQFILRGIGDELDDARWFASLLDGRIVTGGVHEVRLRLLDRLGRAIEHSGARSVIEVGCGTGRNLLYLKERFPHLQVTGLDLSPASVEFGILAADRFGHEATFVARDVTTDWVVEPADLVFSMHAVEQLPTQAPGVVAQMCAHARDTVLLLEPLPDLWRGLAGLAGRSRARYLDRLPAGALDGLDVMSLDLLPFGMALNRTSEAWLRGSAS